MRTTNLRLICALLVLGAVTAFALSSADNTALVNWLKANTPRTVQDAQIKLDSPASFTSKTTTNTVARDARVVRIERKLMTAMADEGITRAQARALGLPLPRITGGTIVTNIRTRSIAGPAVWKDIGLSGKPTDAEVRSAMKEAAR